VVEMLCYSVIVACLIGAFLLFQLSSDIPRCPSCQVATMVLAREIPETFPPVFELLYRCPTCEVSIWRRLVDAPPN
jgi:uncharacterized protein with PIN domain